MRTCLLLLVTLLAAAAFVDGVAVNRQQYKQFSSFVKTYNKKYLTTEFAQRFEIFKRNLVAIEEHNNNPASMSTMGINQFADMTTEEVSRRANGHRLSASSIRKHPRGMSIAKPQDPPASLDWRAKGAVTPVNNQGECASDWAFAVTGVCEGACAIKSGTLVPLSAQQLLDCVPGSQGCNGGDPDDAYKYIVSNGGICSASAYPYTGQPQACQKCTPSCAISGYVDLPFDSSNPNNETSLFDAIQLGPVLVAIEADTAVFQMYDGGVLSSSSCGTTVDHTVLVVGYDVDSSSGTPYWIVKNSWGTDWGLSGYVWIARNMNVCGINQDASYVIAA